MANRPSKTQPIKPGMAEFLGPAAKAGEREPYKGEAGWQSENRKRQVLILSLNP